MNIKSYFYSIFLTCFLGVSIYAQDDKPKTMGDQIKDSFASATNSVAGILFKEVPVYFDGDKAKSSNIIDYYDLIESIQLKKTPFYSILSGKLEKDSPELFQKISQFKRNKEIKEDLIVQIEKEFGVTAQLLKANDYYFLKFLARPLTKERVDLIVRPIPEKLYDEIKNNQTGDQFSEELDALIDSYLGKARFGPGKYKFMNRTAYFEVLIAQKQSEFSDEFKAELSAYQDLSKISNKPWDSLRKRIVESLGVTDAAIDANSYELVSMLSKGVSGHTYPEEIIEGIKADFQKGLEKQAIDENGVAFVYFKKKFADEQKTVFQNKFYSLKAAIHLHEVLPKVSKEMNDKIAALFAANEVPSEISTGIEKALTDVILNNDLTQASTVVYQDKVKEMGSRNFVAAIGVLYPKNRGLPVIVLVLLIGGITFTILYQFVGWKGFKHCIDVIRGRYDNPEDDGEITHFQALTSALSATIGLGNIAGVAIAVCAGGPGAVFWMWLTAFFGMNSKFSSCMLSQVYRDVDKETGKIKGGPMYYLSKGIADLYPSLTFLGKFLGVLFAVFCIFGSFGGGNMFQGNQTYQIFKSTFQLGDAEIWKWVIGIALSIGSGLVILGGIKKIGSFTSKLVPIMCGFYVLTCIFIIVSNFSNIPATFASIFVEAFNFKSAMWGGFIGILMQGVKRAVFSNEAGLGSAAIAHAAAKTDEPVREGIVASIGPFVDTILICTMTALTILVTNAHISGAAPGVEVTSVAFATVHWVFPYLLTIAVLFFSFSTVISWSYYGEKCVEYLFGKNSIGAYRFIFVVCIALGPVMELGPILDFADMMLLSMAFPNIIGSILLYRKGKILLNDYWSRYQNGEMKVYK